MKIAYEKYENCMRKVDYNISYYHILDKQTRQVLVFIAVILIDIMD